MTRLAFVDDFTDPDTLDWGATGGPGYNWYLDRPFGWAPFTPGEITLRNSVLTLNPVGSRPYANWDISTLSAKSGAGHTFRFGFFEMLGRFDPSLGGANPGFPAWWAESAEHTVIEDPAAYAELDFFEAFTPKGQSYNHGYYTTIHDWDSVPGAEHHYQNSQNYHQLGLDYSQWNRFGCLWVPGQVTWFANNSVVTSVTYSATTTPSPPAVPTGAPVGTFDIVDHDKLGMALILGTGIGWPFDIDWVKVWWFPDTMPA